MSLNELFIMYFGIIDERRCKVNVLHSLIDVLKLCLIVTLCGVDELDKIADYGENKKILIYWKYYNLVIIDEISMYIFKKLLTKKVKKYKICIDKNAINYIL